MTPRRGRPLAGRDRGAGRGGRAAPGVTWAGRPRRHKVTRVTFAAGNGPPAAVSCPPSSADTPGGSPFTEGLGRRALTSVFRLNIRADPEGFLDVKLVIRGYGNLTVVTTGSVSIPSCCQAFWLAALPVTLQTGLSQAAVQACQGIESKMRTLICRCNTQVNRLLPISSTKASSIA